VDLAMVRRVLKHSTLGYLAQFSGAVVKGLGVVAAVLAVHACLPASTPAMWRFAAEAVAGAAVFTATNATLVFNPLRAIREIATL